MTRPRWNRARRRAHRRLFGRKATPNDLLPSTSYRYRLLFAPPVIAPYWEIIDEGYFYTRPFAKHGPHARRVAMA